MTLWITLRRYAFLPVLLTPLAPLAACDEPPNEQRIERLEDGTEDLEERLEELEERVRALEQGRAS